MLLVKSKYKIAKRLGAGVFEKTQTPKFALAESRSPRKMSRGRGGGSDYGRQLLEKQRVRYTYGLSEKQLSNYAHAAFEQANPSAALHKELEMRADNAVYRAGLASTRRAARQIVSHGHITVNGTRITTPSYRLKKGDVIAVREGSRSSALFAGIAEKMKEGEVRTSAWVTLNPDLLRAEVAAEPTFSAGETGLDYATVFEFYSR